MKIKVVQSRVKALDIKYNYESIVHEINETDSGVSLIVFSLNALFGKMHKDRIFEKGIRDDIIYFQEELLKINNPQAIVWGGLFFEEDEIYECIYFKQNEDLKIIYKRNIDKVNYLNETRYYSADKISQGIVILEKQKISISFFEEFVERDVDLHIVLDSSYWYKGIKDKRIDKLSLGEVPSIYVNHVGMQNNGKNVFIYDGGSFVSMNDKIYPLFEDFKPNSIILKPNEAIPEERTEDHIYPALIALLRYYDEEVFPFEPKWIVGASGGLDSSITIGMLVRALGHDRVLAVTMPSRYNKQLTQDNANILTENLGVECLNIPVESLAKETVETLSKADLDGSKGLAYENIQARLRGHILMSISSLRNGIIMNNGNKLEIAFGYATLYGDSIGALSLLGDLNKLEVSELGELLNKDFGLEVIPKNILAKVSDDTISWVFAPSAELAKDQVDPMKWGYHDYLVEYLLEHSVEEILKLYLTKEIYTTKFGPYLEMYGLNDPKLFIEDLDWVIQQFYGSIYKRIQMPPIAVMTQKAFGTGYVESQYPYFPSREYEKLRKKILGETDDSIDER